MGYVILDNIAHEETGEPNAHDRKDQIEPVECFHSEAGAQKVLYLMYHQMQHIGSYRCQEAHEERQQKGELTV